MSLAVSAVGLAALASLETVLLQPARQIGGISVRCAIEESHSDRVHVTRNPVETGAKVADHAFREPFSVTLRYGWSNADPENDLGSEAYARDIYNQLQALQQSRQPFQIITGKRVYDRMMMEELEVRTDATSEYNLIVEARCAELLIVSTRAVPLAPNPSAAQAPNITAAQRTGPVQPVQQPRPTFAALSGFTPGFNATPV